MKRLLVRGAAALRVVSRAAIRHHRAVNIGAHLCLVSVAYFLAFALRFDFDLPPQQVSWFVKTLPVLLLIRMATFHWMHLHQGLWRYVSMRDLLTILKAVTLSSVAFVATAVAVYGHGFPRSVLLLDWMLCVAIVGGLRVVIRTVRDPSIRTRRGGRRALVVGAGDAGDSLIREIGRDRHGRYRIVGLVDDDPGKQGMRLHGIPVFGTPEDLPGLARQYKVQEILIAMPSATREQWLRVMRYCRACALPFKSVPPLRDLLAGKAGIGQLQEVRPEDVLGRERVHLDDAQLRQNLCGKRVVVTGAAGSIGSELCRQLAALSPEELVLIDRAENNLYFVHLELVRTFPQLTIVPVVGDISDGCKIEEVIRHHRPHALYHAAAYKHVPLMEADPLEAVKNNVFGTDVVAAAALAGGVEKFVLISTDKAVRPVGVMGMTKRLAEGLVRYYGDGDRDFVAVRFGNVLGSDGSVLPLFRWQIASGGPVTITEPEASRYFMLISEAAQLVLQAGALGRGGEVFFLDMGEPVRILDLAETVIRQSGLEPHQDIAVEFVGLRPGERLREELVLDDETLSPTAHARVLRVRGQPFDREAFRDELEMLRKLVEIRDRDGVRHALKDMSERY